MLEFIIQMYKDLWSWCFNVLANLELAEGVTIWSLTIVTFVCCGLVAVIIQRFGGSGISTGMSGGISAYEHYQDEAQRKLAKEAMQQERESYAYYEKNRLRNESYASRFNAKYHPNTKSKHK